jgi:hypothetical protein
LALSFWLLALGFWLANPNGKIFWPRICANAREFWKDLKDRKIAVIGDRA